jgi:hypothetical protein
MHRTTTRRRKRLGAVVAVAAAAAVSVGLMAPPASADPSGDASGLQATLGILGVTVPPTPQAILPPGGVQNIVNLNLGVVTAQVLSAASQATGPNSVASAASVANANVAGLVTAGVVTAECTADPSGADGSSALLGTTVLGTPIAVAVPPNTSLLGLATLNEQTRTANGIRVRAVHVNIPIVGEVIVSQATCEPGASARLLSATAAGAAGATSANPNLTG